MSFPVGSRLDFQWFPAVALWMFLFGLAVSTTRSAHSALALLVVGLLYALIAYVLTGLARVAARHGRWLELAGSLVVGFVAAWHLREQTRPAGVGPTLWTMEGMVPFLVTVLFVGTVQLLFSRLTRPRIFRPGGGWSLGICAVMFMVLLVGSYHSSETLRWHLLRHHKLIGMPAFHLLSPPVATLEDDDWSRHQGGVIAQPAWVHGTGVETATAEHDLGSAVDVEGTAEERSSHTRELAPDVVFVLLDTLRADTLAAYGGDPSLMPRLNAFADKALIFTDVIANSSWTRPSVASFFTGLAPEEHGAVKYVYPISPGAVTMAEVFQRRGYETAAFVANYEAVSDGSGFGRGFNHFEPLQASAQKYDRADLVTSRVAEWMSMRAASDDRAPLFLYVHYLDPHAPYLSSGLERGNDGVVSHEEAIELYRDEARFLDAELQRLLFTLRSRSSRPLVTLITSDHGEEFGEHNGRGHAETLYSEVLDIPAVLSIEESGRPTLRGVIGDPLEARDFFEILLRSAESLELVLPTRLLNRNTRVSSISFSKGGGTVRNLVRPDREDIYARMAERDGWRLIWSAYGPTRELYNLRTDPGETVNQVAQRPDVAESLTRFLDLTPPWWSRPGAIGVSEESLDRLRGLGYIR